MIVILSVFASSSYSSAIKRRHKKMLCKRIKRLKKEGTNQPGEDTVNAENMILHNELNFFATLRRKKTIRIFFFSKQTHHKNSAGSQMYFFSSKNTEATTLDSKNEENLMVVARANLLRLLPSSSNANDVHFHF